MIPNREGGIAASWQRTLAGIPTLLGRLAYMTSLRNANSGKYEHFGLAQRIGPDETDLLIRKSHSGVFQEWLNFDLERQKGELEEYFDSAAGDKRETIVNWLSVEPYAAWIPAESRDVERQLFNSDLRIVVNLIRADYGIASRDPDS